MKIIYLTLAASVLSACSLTLPVQGQTQHSRETFTGTATGYLDRSGVISIANNKGTTCDGNFIYTKQREGKGTFTCSDGRSGPFEFVSAGKHGTGTADLSGEKFVFTFGK